MKAAAQRLQKMRRASLNLVVDGHRAREETRAARCRLVPARKRDHRSHVGMQPELEIAAVHPWGGILGGRVDDMPDEFALRVLRERMPEVRPDAPNRGDEFLERLPVERQTAQEHESPSRPDLFGGSPKACAELAEVKVGSTERVRRNEPPRVPYLADRASELRAVAGRKLQRVVGGGRKGVAAPTHRIGGGLHHSSFHPSTLLAYRQAVFLPRAGSAASRRSA